MRPSYVIQIPVVVDTGAAAKKGSFSGSNALTVRWVTRGGRGRERNKCISNRVTLVKSTLICLFTPPAPLLPLPISRGAHFFALLPLLFLFGIVAFTGQVAFLKQLFRSNFSNILIWTISIPGTEVQRRRRYCITDSLFSPFL